MATQMRYCVLGGRFTRQYLEDNSYLSGFVLDFSLYTSFRIF